MTERPTILLLLLPTGALFVYVTRMILTAPLTGNALTRSFAKSLGVYLAVTFLALGAAWLLGSVSGVDLFEWWTRAWEAEDDAVLLVSSLHGSILPLIPMLVSWRLYRYPTVVESLELSAEFPFNLFFDEDKDRRGLALFLGGSFAIGFVVLIAVSLTSASDIVFGTAVSSIGISILSTVESSWSFIDDLLQIIGMLFSIAVLSYVVWSGFTEDRGVLVGLVILFGLFGFFAWATGNLDEVMDALRGPFVRMSERFFN